MDDVTGWTSTVVLGDGSTAVVRPIRPDDASALDTFHRAQSPESRYLRFFTPKPTLSKAALTRFTSVDSIDRAAFVVEQYGEFVAWASYERWKHRDDAEVAFMVSDEHHGLGIATLLLEHLAALARANGIRRFTAQTLGENRAMLAVFAKAGWPVQRRFESGVVDIDFALDDTAEFVDSVERREQRAESRAVARVLLPQSIAVIGASDVADSIGATIWANVSRDPIRPVYPVNPHHTTVGGRRAFASVAAIPDEISLAVIAVPAAMLDGVLQDCIDSRVRGAVVITSAIDATESATIGRLVERARRNGLRVIGPASMGVAGLRPEVGLQAALVNVTTRPGSVAVSMQSGTLGASLLRLAASLQLGLSWFVSLGDRTDISTNDLLQFWEDDEATNVIALYTESVGNARKFARIARRVALRRPIVVVRTGAALVGAAPDALYRQSGVIEVPTVAALLDTARVLASQPLMNGDRVAIVSNARSPAVAARATLEAAGLTVIDAPVTLDWRSTADDYRAAIANADADAVVVIHAPPTEHSIHGPTAAIDAAAGLLSKPIVAVMLGLVDGPLCAGSNVPNFAFPEQAAAVLGRIWEYSQWRAAALDAEPDDPPAGLDRVRAAALVAEQRGALPGHTVAADTAVARQLLAAYGVTMPPTVLVDARGAAAAATELGFPVAVKALRRSPGRSIESGVALDLADAPDVAAAVATMTTHLGHDASEVYVQRMVAPGVEMRVRVVADEAVGPMISVGLGGFQADLIADAATRLVPVSPSAARAMVAETRAAGALDGEGDLDALADVVVRVAQLASDHPDIVGIDLNPVLIVDGGASVVDALVEIAPRTHPTRPTRRLDDGN